MEATDQDMSDVSPSYGMGRRRRWSRTRRRRRALLPRPARRQAAPPGPAPRNAGTVANGKSAVAPYGLGMIRLSLGCGTVFGHAGSIAGYEAYAYNSKDGRR